MEGIKGCGVLPVYAKAQDTDESDWHLKNDIDELQPRSIEGEVRSSNIEHEDDQEIDDDFDWLSENDIDEYENDHEIDDDFEWLSENDIDENDQEQPSYSRKEEEQLSVSRPPIKHVYVKRRRT
ncbi:putative disease resistance protein (TIR-NBS-LRR class), partial [Trifolium medium]|nr:putative disease resistance protein (TIR-NBS-LRR class) [Trifolium medium]